MLNKAASFSRRLQLKGETLVPLRSKGESPAIGEWAEVMSEDGDAGGPASGPVSLQGDSMKA